MSTLYVPINATLEDDIFTVPLSSLITLFAVKYCNPSDVSIALISSSSPAPTFPVCLSSLSYSLLDQVPPPARCLQLPALALGAACVAGLCAVMRRLVAPALLGFRAASLAACAQASPWTRFCEVDFPAAVAWGEAGQECARFEAHMARPTSVKNVVEQRTFSEGTDVTVADIILFPCFYVLMKVARESVLDLLPLTSAWYSKMLEQEGIREAMDLIQDFPGRVLTPQAADTVSISDSLYKRDPRRYKPASRIFTRQEDVDTSLRLVEESGLVATWLEQPFGWEVPLDWEEIPRDAHPEVPACRVERKRAQLGNVARAAAALAKPGDVVVDFCSGGGHLGLLLAVMLPACHVLLLENKAESLGRAQVRGDRMGLNNVAYLQTNLDYFSGEFDVGVALHACGVATDLVLARCVSQRAAFAICPCCYGGVQSTPALVYPRSAQLGAMTLRDYLVLAHAADQTHSAAHGKTAQGNRCMAAVDADRCQAAHEQGYTVSLSKMQPDTCSPKNNMLVGVPS